MMDLKNETNGNNLEEVNFKEYFEKKENYGDWTSRGGKRLLLNTLYLNCFYPEGKRWYPKERIRIQLQEAMGYLFIYLNLWFLLNA